MQNVAKSYIIVLFFPGTKVPGFYMSPFQGFWKDEMWNMKHWKRLAVARIDSFFANLSWKRETFVNFARS